MRIQAQALPGIIFTFYLALRSILVYSEINLNFNIQVDQYSSYTIYMTLQKFSILVVGSILENLLAKSCIGM